MAVLPSSHARDFWWKSEALSALNFDNRFGNGISKGDLFKMIKNGKTNSCALENVAEDMAFPCRPGYSATTYVGHSQCNTNMIGHERQDKTNCTLVCTYHMYANFL